MHWSNGNNDANEIPFFALFFVRFIQSFIYLFIFARFDGCGCGCKREICIFHAVLNHFHYMPQHTHTHTSKTENREQMYLTNKHQVPYIPNFLMQQYAMCECLNVLDKNVKCKMLTRLAKATANCKKRRNEAKSIQSMSIQLSILVHFFSFLIYLSSIVRCEEQL